MFAVFLCPHPYKAGQSVLCYIHWNTGSYTSLPCQLWVHTVLNLSPPSQALRRRVGHSGQLSLVRPVKHGRVFLLAFQKLSVCVENMPPCMHVCRSEDTFWGKGSLFALCLRQGLSCFCHCTADSWPADHQVPN